MEIAAGNFKDLGQTWDFRRRFYVLLQVAQSELFIEIEPPGVQLAVLTDRSCMSTACTDLSNSDVL